MSTYKTGNPLGSAAVKDLFDNAENLDFALNSLTALIWTDRLGKTRRSFFGMESAFVTQLTSQESRFNTFIQSSGYQIVGDYTAGPLTLTEYNQLIRYNNELYKLTATTDIPFTTAGNTDETWTSTDAAHFVSVGDAALRQNLGSSEKGFGTDMVSLAIHEYINEKGLFTDTSITHWFGNPTFEVFGAIPDDITKASENAIAINKALQWSRENNGRPVSPTQGVSYYFDDTLEFVDQGDGTDVGKSARVVGPNDMSSLLIPVGGDGTKPAIRALGNLGTSGSMSARGVQITGLKIMAADWLLSPDDDDVYPPVVHLENISLWGLFNDIQVWNPQGRGVLAKAVTECLFAEIEVRGAKSLGWEQYEPNPAYNPKDVMFMECSYNRYVRVKAMSCNNYGVQALFTGGNALRFEHCKFQEGLIGMRFVRTHGVRIDTPYYDGPADRYATGEKIAIQIDGPGAANFSISGGRCWNCHVGVDFIQCNLASVMDLNMDFTSPAGSNIYGVRAGVLVTLPVDTNVATYQDNSTKGVISGFMRTYDTGYSPQWTITNGSVSVGNGTQTGRKTRNFNKVEVNARLVVGSSTVIEGTNLTLTLPYNTVVTGQSLSCIAYDASAAKFYHGRALISGQGAALVFEKYLTAYAVSPSTAYPFYPAAGDFFQIEGYYFLK
ncbi:hypothetical protein DET57_11479 [Klebsiella oxytoca]|uniref:Tail spike TSP1/Gp66 N-terminal domain-containing protein n=1 Tax=Klebsiella oxytoca TaxID=571 RepID=A0A318FG32_KLEOX|nr:hypothetical protein [Klebsiella oxytoca]PXW42087.1 hypothetical protein DET57_11479 [Klebsiella oxytoca]